MLDRFPDEARGAWHRLLSDIVGGGRAASRLIAALDAPVEPLLEGVDVEAALAAADVAADAHDAAAASLDERRARTRRPRRSLAPAPQGRREPDVAPRVGATA